MDEGDADGPLRAVGSSPSQGGTIGADHNVEEVHSVMEAHCALAQDTKIAADAPAPDT